MWSRIGSTAAWLGILLLIGCQQYSFLYANPEVKTALPRILVQPIPGWYGEELRQNLSVVFAGDPNKPACLTLTVELDFYLPKSSFADRQAIIIQPFFHDSHNNVETIEASAKVRLRNATSDKILAQYQLNAVTPFLNRGSLIRSLDSQRAGLSRAMQDLGKKIQRMVLAHLHQHVTIC